MIGTGLDYDPPLSVAERVVDAVSEAEGESPTEITPPLYHVVDPEALDAVTESIGPGGTVAFEYCGHEVLVDGDGDVSIGD